MKKVFEKKDLPEEIFKAIENRVVTYRGCGMGKYCGNMLIKYNKKEYMISYELFKELNEIKNIEFSAPFRKQ